MNANFKKLLLKLANNKADKGFTLIELLVATIIVGVLAVVALPNLLGQVGKAREVEVKNGLGAINRAQQAYHFEHKEFLDAAEPDKNNELGVVLDSKYYTFEPTSVDGDTATAIATTQFKNAVKDGEFKNAVKDGVRGYAAAIGFDSNTGQYNTAICQSNQVGQDATPKASTTNSTCGEDSQKIN